MPHRIMKVIEISVGSPRLRHGFFDHGKVRCASHPRRSRGLANLRFVNACRYVGCLVLFAILVFAARSRAALAEQPAYPPMVSLEEIQQRINACPHEHPRLLVTRNQLAKIRSSLDRDPLRRKLADYIIDEATNLLDEPPIERTLVGRRLLGESRRCVARVLTLAMAYHLTGNRQYADRCQKEMLAVARFSDWHPQHFLDVAEMTFGMAIGYDWLYYQLDDASRREIRRAIVEKGVRVPFDTKYNEWVRRDNNWGQVCHGGLTIGALAVLEDEPKLAARTVHSALENVVVSMGAFAPKGSYPEGPGYWAYGTTYNVLLIAALESSLGSDFGLSHAPGFDQTGAYPALVCGPSGLMFNYADGGADGRSPQPARLWLATRFHRPDWLIGERDVWAKSVSRHSADERRDPMRMSPLGLLWMTPPQSDANTNVQLPLAWSSGGPVPIAVLRSSWTDPRATFIGLKGGSPAYNHGHMDIGSFVLDSDGVRWASDLGAEDYNAIEQRHMDLWNRAQNSDRWTIFRLSSFSHNTLVIDDQLQVAAGNAPMTSFSDDAQRPFAIVDMSPVYEGEAASARRGVTLLPSREVLVQDELTGLKPGSHVRWGMITRGRPDELGKDSLVLRQGAKQLKLAVVEPANVEWQEIDTAKPRHEWDTPNPGTRMVAFQATAPASGKLTLVVAATPGSCDKPVAAELKVRRLEDWGKQFGRNDHLRTGTKQNE